MSRVIDDLCQLVAANRNGSEAVNNVTRQRHAARRTRSGVAGL